MQTRYHNLHPDLKARFDKLDNALESAEPVELLLRGNTGIDASISSPILPSRIDGKTVANLVPLLDSGAWFLNANTKVLSPNTAQHTHDGTTSMTYNSISINVKPNTAYVARLGICSVNDFNFEVKMMKADGTTIGSLDPKTPALGGVRSVGGTTTADTVKINIYAYPKTSVAGSPTFGEISLFESAQDQPFVANVKGITNPTVLNTTNGTSLVVPTTLHTGEYVELRENGDLVKTKKWQELVLDGNIPWRFYGAQSGSKTLALLNYATPKTSNEHTIVKYNGLILTVTAWDNRFSDSTSLYHDSKDLLITVSNTDSGWGPDYTPTTDEIKAYFLGWRMRDPMTTNPYNGTGGKYWGTIASGGADLGTATLPTTQAPKDARWQPYRLLYELATPVEEVIMPYGDLTINKGVNNITVTSGRIVNERINKMFHYGESDSRIINNRVMSPVKFATKDILNIYTDNVPDTRWTIYESANQTALFGLKGAWLPNSMYNTTSSYAIDYDPLYPWEVTVPLTSLTVIGYVSLQAITDSLVRTTANQADTVRRMLDNAVNEGEGVQWITPTLLNGFLPYSDYINSYHKDSSNTVRINIMLSGAPTAANTEVLVLPKGYRPSKLTVGISKHYSPNNVVGFVYVEPSGKLTFSNSDAVGQQYHIIDFSFKAEQ